MFRHAPRSRHRTTYRRFAADRLEHLERRDLLSGSPTVQKVEVASTSWSSAFTDYLQTAGLGTNGYAIPVGSSAQSATLTWTNLDQILITFSEDVYVDAADLSLSGVNYVAYEFSAFHYDPQTCLAMWTLGTPLDKDRLRLDLDANGADPVRDMGDNILDGEWTNDSSTVSGNGTAGGDFQFNFNVLPTDVNNTGNITTYDYVYIRQLDGKTTTSAGYIAKRDIDGNGVINSVDWQEALDRALEALPSGSPAGTNNDAPTTSGLDLIEISDVESDIAFSLFSGFNDTESGSSGLTYTIVSNDNPNVLDSLDINQSTKSLVLNAAASVSGRANLIVRATDAGGLFVDTVITVDVNYENQPPLISHLFFEYAGANTWIISGDVSDADDDVANFIVEFFGVFATRSAVDEYGHFEFAYILDESEAGTEYAVTYDPHGAESNIPFGDTSLT